MFDVRCLVWFECVIRCLCYEMVCDKRYVV